MREGQDIGTIRLRLLALVLAVALTWYARDPAPGPMRRVKRGGGRPGEERREPKSPTASDREPVRMGADALKSAPDPLSSADQDIDDLEWPEVIGVR